MKCPLCDFENEEGSKFCKKCNEPLSKQGHSEGNPYIKKRGMKTSLLTYLRRKRREKIFFKERFFSASYSRYYSRVFIFNPSPNPKDTTYLFECSSEVYRNAVYN